MARATRIFLDMALDAAKTLKSAGAISWRYIKVEAVPPLTVNFFQGPAGQKLEALIENMANKIVGGLAGKIKEMDEEVERQKREKVAMLKAKLEQEKAEAENLASEKKKTAAKKNEEEKKKAAQAAKESEEAKVATPKKSLANVKENPKKSKDNKPKREPK